MDSARRTFQKQETGPPGSFPPILEHLIRQRGLPAGMDLEGYLRPRLKDLADPFLIPDMRPAVERIFSPSIGVKKSAFTATMTSMACLRSP